MSAPRRVSLKDRSPLDDLFRRTETERGPEMVAPAEPPAPGASAFRQTTILLEDRHLDWLDRKCTEARQKGGKAIRKAALIRSLLELAMSSPVDLTGLRAEEELPQRLEEAIKGK